MIEDSVVVSGNAGNADDDIVATDDMDAVDINAGVEVTDTSLFLMMS